MTRLTRVLVVDDEPAIHRFLTPALVANHYDVLRADNGAAALQRIANDAPDIVVLDLGLPDMDGKEVIGRAREWTDVPIVVLSARDREAEKIAALDRGADDFINKPFGVGELMARLRAAPPAQLLGRPVQAADLAAAEPPVDAVRLSGDGVRVIVRPSGTEPKLKAYLETVVPVHEDAGLIAARGRGEDELDQLRAEMSATLGL